VLNIEADSDRAKMVIIYVPYNTIQYKWNL